MTVRTPTYMGLRVYRYRPRTTSVVGGSVGAGVPRPVTAKSHKHHVDRSAEKQQHPGTTERAAPWKFFSRRNTATNRRRWAYRLWENVLRRRLKPGASSQEGACPALAIM